MRDSWHPGWFFAVWQGFFVKFLSTALKKLLIRQNNSVALLFIGNLFIFEMEYLGVYPIFLAFL
uniref:hypothetical protein n=1 Tax=Wolbachia endosymbiont of Ctenocephalides felis wCfeT TaxID=2732593 RepID=UPI001444D28E|nr:hypothetical protein [Wolbachia endosymbiont of Ctenocephalides felis wCfeT]